MALDRECEKLTDIQEECASENGWCISVYDKDKVVHTALDSLVSM